MFSILHVLNFPNCSMNRAVGIHSSHPCPSMGKWKSCMSLSLTYQLKHTNQHGICCLFYNHKNQNAKFSHFVRTCLWIVGVKQSTQRKLMQEWGKKHKGKAAAGWPGFKLVNLYLWGSSANHSSTTLPCSMLCLSDFTPTKIHSSCECRE